MSTGRGWRTFFLSILGFAKLSGATVERGMRHINKVSPHCPQILYHKSKDQFHNGLSEAASGHFETVIWSGGAVEI